MRTFSLSLTYGELTVHTFGRGPRLLIGLHGYALEGEALAPLATALEEHFTLLAPDLPFHGSSQWKRSFFNLADMRELIHALCARHNSRHFSLLGHSLGGRIALCLYPSLSRQLDYLILLAPAGIGSYRLLQPNWLRRSLERSLRRPDWLGKLIRKGHHWGWLSQYHRRYAEVHLLPPDGRRRLFQVWNSLSHFQPEQSSIREALWDQPVPLLLGLGSKDRVIKNEPVRNYFMDYPRLYLRDLPLGHHLLTSEVGKWLASVMDTDGKGG